MIPALHDIALLISALSGHPIDQTVFARNAARPPALQRVFEGLRFPEPLERIALDVLDQLINGGEAFFVIFLPMEVHQVATAASWPAARNGNPPHPSAPIRPARCNATTPA